VSNKKRVEQTTPHRYFTPKNALRAGQKEQQYNAILQNAFLRSVTRSSASWINVIGARVAAPTIKSDLKDQRPML
jgi:hypothetical protein